MAILDNMEVVRRNLQRIMRWRDLSANSLAELSGVPQPTISKFLNGTHQEIRASNIEKIAKSLGLTSEALRREEGAELSQHQQILSNEELELLLSFRVLPPSKQREVVDNVKKEEEKIIEVLRHHGIKP